MLPTSAKAPFRFTPKNVEGQPGAPVYLLKVASLLERAAFRRAVAASGAAYRPEDELKECLLEGIAAVVDPAQQSDLSDIVEAFFADDRDDGTRAKMAEIERVIRANHPPYAAMVADRGHYLEVAPIIAAQHFLLGWENVDVTFDRRGGLVSEDCLAQLPEGHLDAIGFKILDLMRPGKDQEKNSESPSPSQPIPAISTAAPMLQTGQDGTSSASDTTETPGSC